MCDPAEHADRDGDPGAAPAGAAVENPVIIGERIP